MIGFRHVDFRRQRRPPRGVVGFHERLTGMPTIGVQDGGRHRGIPPER